MESEAVSVVEAEVVTCTREPWKDELLRRMGEGIPLRQACDQDGIPSYRTVYRRAVDDPAFGRELNEARIKLAWAQQDDLDGYITEARTADPDSVPGLRLASDILKFKLVKVLPKLYGDSPTTVIDNRTQVVVLSDERRAELQDRLKRLQTGEHESKDNQS